MRIAGWMDGCAHTPAAGAARGHPCPRAHTPALCPTHPVTCLHACLPACNLPDALCPTHPNPPYLCPLPGSPWFVEEVAAHEVVDRVVSLVLQAALCGDRAQRGAALIQHAQLGGRG